MGDERGAAARRTDDPRTSRVFVPVLVFVVVDDGDHPYVVIVVAVAFMVACHPFGQENVVIDERKLGGWKSAVPRNVVATEQHAEIADARER